MRALRDCLPWARGREPDVSEPLPPPVARERHPSALARAGVASLEVEGLPPPAPSASSPVDARAASPGPGPAQLPRIDALPRGARAPRCSRSTHGNERRIETSHFTYRAHRPAVGRLWRVTVTPVSAGARFYIDARGEGLAVTCPLDALPAYIAQCERELEGYWGAALDTRRDW